MFTLRREPKWVKDWSNPFNLNPKHLTCFRLQSIILRIVISSNCNLTTPDFRSRIQRVPLHTWSIISFVHFHFQHNAYAAVDANNSALLAFVK
jgi:hypothetical protein